ncbi:hypothetical protein [Yoonia sp.]|nr:hypothetical protein [Yoonia sp.]
MKPMLIAFVVAGLIAFGADYGLDYAGFTSQERTAGAAVRLD